MWIIKPTILNVRNKTEFCRLLSITEDTLDKIIRDKDLQIEVIELPKKRGWYRKVYKINNPNYKALLRNIYLKLSEIVKFEECVQWFVKWKSTFTNAKKHLNKRIIIHIDIKNFFETIKVWNNIFIEIWFNEQISDILSNLCFFNSILPTGFPTSPIISNFYFRNIDIEFSKIAANNDYNYSRYWDDITFSTQKNQLISKELLVEILNRNELRINEDKFKIERKWWPQYVTWLTVVDRISPHIPRKLKRKIRLELHYISMYGLEEHLKNANGKNINTIFNDLIDAQIRWWKWYMWIMEPSLIKYIDDLEISSSENQ